MHTTAITASTHKRPCHPLSSTSAPPSRGPAAAPTAAAAPQRDTARSCASPVLDTEIRLSPHDRIVAPAAPWMKRPAITAPPEDDSAIRMQDATNSSSPSWNTRFRPKTSPSDPEVTMTAAPTREYPVTAHWRVVTSMPVSSLIAGNRMLTADVLAFTTRVDRHVTAKTPRACEAEAAGVVSALPEPAKGSVPVIWASPHRGMADETSA